MIDLFFDIQRFDNNNIAISLDASPQNSASVTTSNGAHTVNVSLGGSGGSYEFWISNFDTDDEILFQNASFSISGISADTTNGVIVTANDNKYTVTIHGVKENLTQSTTTRIRAKLYTNSPKIITNSNLKVSRAQAKSIKEAHLCSDIQT